jgi:hypothetical protein
MTKFEALQLYKNWSIIKNDLFENEYLSEDIFQIQKNNYVIDIGWYEGPNLFYIYLIKDFEWEHPLVKISAYCREQCFVALEFCINYEKILS